MISPIVGFTGTALLLLGAKIVIKQPDFYSAPELDQAPQIWMRGLLLLTFAGVNFAHGSSDGQKGMGLIY